MNNSTIGYLSLGTYYSYTTVGTSAILTNCLVLLILSTNKNLFINSAFVIGLAFGDVLDGVGLLGNGVRRLYMAVNGIPNGNIHPFQCMHLFTPVFLLGNQIPGTMFALIGLERYLAVGHFHWYYAKWTPKKAWQCFLVAYVICAVSLTGAFILVYNQPAEATVSSLCTTQTVMGPRYMFYNYGITVVGGFIAVVTTLIAMVIFTKQKNRIIRHGNNENSIKMLPYVKRQWRHTRSMFCIALLDFGLVVVPNLLITLSNVFGISISASLGSSSLMTVCARSCFNLFIYLICNHEFRKAAFKIICLRKYVSTADKFKSTTAAVTPKQMPGLAWANNSRTMEAESKF